MDEIFLDTSAWVAWLSGESRAAPRTGHGALVGSTLLLAEATSLVVRQRLRQDSVELLLASVRLVDPTPEDLVSAGQLHGELRLAGNRKASLNDCIMYQTARRLGLVLLTHDRDLQGHPGVRVV